MRGLIIKNMGNDIWVQLSDGSISLCKLKGNFRIQGIKSTSPVAVGDIVRVDDNGQISDIEPRKNYIARRSINLSRQIHIIAANIDIAILIVTLKKPETSLNFIDRFIASAEAYGVETILVFNKIDLLDSSDIKSFDDIIRVYSSIGYKCIRTNALEKRGLDEITQAIDGKIALLSGNSGVGKSTIINAIIGDDKAKTAEISEFHQKGMHTTTFSEGYCINSNTYLIDTPGIKGFGVVDMDKSEISHYFVEIFSTSKNCKYPNCTHIHEPDCAVLEAIDKGIISKWRYYSYLSMMEEVSNIKKYR